jgi:hypothetical protein
VERTLAKEHDQRILEIDDLRAGLREALADVAPGVFGTPSSVRPASGSIRSRARMPVPAPREPTSTLSKAASEASMQTPVPTGVRRRRGLFGAAIGVAIIGAVGLGLLAKSKSRHAAVTDEQGPKIESLPPASSAAPSSVASLAPVSSAPLSAAPVSTPVSTAISTPVSSAPVSRPASSKPKPPPVVVSSAPPPVIVPPATSAASSAPPLPAVATTIVTLRLDPANASLVFDGAPVAGGQVVVPHDGKKHKLAASAPGFAPQSYDLDETSRPSLFVRLRKLRPDAPAGSSAAPPPLPP